MSSRFTSWALGLSALFFLTSPTPALADSADDIVTTLGYDKYYVNLANLMVEQAIIKLQSLNASAADLQNDRVKITADTSGYKPVFLGAIAKSYRSHFTADELRQLLAFYRSPLGKKVGAMQNPIKDDVAAASRDAGMFIGVQAAQLAK